MRGTEEIDGQRPQAADALPGGKCSGAEPVVPLQVVRLPQRAARVHRVAAEHHLLAAVVEQHRAGVRAVARREQKAQPAAAPEHLLVAAHGGIIDAGHAAGKYVVARRTAPAELESGRRLLAGPKRTQKGFLPGRRMHRKRPRGTRLEAVALVGVVMGEEDVLQAPDAQGRQRLEPAPAAEVDRDRGRPVAHHVDVARVPEQPQIVVQRNRLRRVRRRLIPVPGPAIELHVGQYTRS